MFSSYLFQVMKPIGGVGARESRGVAFVFNTIANNTMIDRNLFWILGTW